MNNDFENILLQLVAELDQQQKQVDRKIIKKRSPYSEKITDFIGTTLELDLYLSLGLEEKTIVRPSLISTIDPNYAYQFGKTNRQRMLSGDPPIDPASEKPYHLHHIGQDFYGPFAEIPSFLHLSPTNFLILHQNNTEESWRRDKRLIEQFRRQRMNHWMKRGQYLYEKKK